MPGVVLPGPHNLVLGVIEELIPMSQPSDSSRNHEKHGEHVSGESHSLVDDSTVEIDVRVQLPLNEVGVTQSNSLQLYCNLNQLLLSSNLEHLLRDLLHNLSPRVVVLVDSMSESVKQSLLVLHIFNELWDIGLLPNLLQHSQHSLIGSTMLRSIQSSSSPGNSCVDVYS